MANSRQFIYGRQATDVDNTANKCTMSSTEAICPHHALVEQNKTIFNVNNHERAMKMRARGFDVHIQLREPATLKSRILDLIVWKKQVQGKDVKRHINLT